MVLVERFNGERECLNVSDVIFFSQKERKYKRERERKSKKKTMSSMKIKERQIISEMNCAKIHC